MDHDKMVAGYIDCALWLSTDDSDKPLDSGEYSLAPETSQQMAKDLADFCAAHQDLVNATIEAGMDEDHIGHNLWLTRNRAGTGFWDRTNPGRGADTVWSDLMTRLTEAAHAAGERWLYVGDDGLVYQA